MQPSLMLPRTAVRLGRYMARPAWSAVGITVREQQWVLRKVTLALSDGAGGNAPGDWPAAPAPPRARRATGLLIQAPANTEAAASFVVENAGPDSVLARFAVREFSDADARTAGAQVTSRRRSSGSARPRTRS
jgi:hypothetical protein